MIKVSVIVPVYNAALYLNECIESLRNQSLADIEIIFIDDASTDQSLEILKEFAELDNRIKIIQLDYNKGAANARNQGLQMARGEYIQFVDADDYLHREALEKLYGYASLNCAEMCYLHIHIKRDCSYKNAFVQRGIIKSYPNVYTGEAILQLFLNENEFFLYLCSVFYKREFIEDNNLLFKKLSIGEGGCFILRALMKAKRVVVSDGDYYNYRIHGQSITHQDNAKMQLLHGQLIQYTDMLIEFGNNSSSVPIRLFLESLYKKMYGGIQNLSQKEFEELYSILTSEFEKYVLHMMRNSNKNYDIRISDQLVARMRASKHVIIYGAGHATREVLNVLDWYHIEIDGIAVTNHSNNPSSICGHHVYEVSEITKSKEDTLVVVAANRIYNEEIKHTLNTKGFLNVEFLNIEI